jgi:hypothetical protein
MRQLPRLGALHHLLLARLPSTFQIARSGRTILPTVVPYRRLHPLCRRKEFGAVLGCERFHFLNECGLLLFA